MCLGQKLLAMPRSYRNRSKARFYLGQVFYFQGRPREALLEFLASGDLFPAETRDWTQAALRALRDNR
jgi:hypothetical protein